MEPRELKYLINYAQRHNMMKQCILDVLNAWNKELEEAYE